MNNSKLLLSYILFFSLITFFSCNSVPETTLSKNINPDDCRIEGTIVSIGEITETSGPCLEHPCVATIEINKVIECGTTFRTPVIKGEKIKLKFAFTLSKTSKELFPKLNYILPGLSIGDKFVGDIQKIEAIQFNNNKTNEYKIFIYDKIE